VQSILTEFGQLKQEPVTEEELRRAKDYMKGSLMLSLESTSSRMANLARQEMYFGRFFSLSELIENIERVTAQDVQRISCSFFDPRHIALTVLGNLNGFKIEREELAC
jgi:predicted Zn-dependent peptidase